MREYRPHDCSCPCVKGSRVGEVSEDRRGEVREVGPWGQGAGEGLGPFQNYLSAKANVLRAFPMASFVVFLMASLGLYNKGMASLVCLVAGRVAGEEGALTVVGGRRGGEQRR